jgi:hypothetical protein
VPGVRRKETVNKRSLRALAPVARNLFRANHSVMMKHAQMGLATYLARFEPAGSSGGQWATPTAGGRG